MPTPPSQSAVVRSALWAAYGDALGFPAELADARLFADRTSGQADGLVPWTRRVGGRRGASVLLPAGTTSDDTQLRLAVSRCIRASGRFDVEAFSKVELPVFLSYELGAGRGTKAAARNLMRRHVRWSSNLFDSKGGRYVDGGGNGAAMRIQPHVWGARDGKPASYLRPMLRDVLTTHGHPRALLGACLHAMALAAALHQQRIPSPDRWAAIVAFLPTVTELITTDEELVDHWLPAWERAADRPLSAAISETVREISRLVDIAADASEDPEPARAYHRLTESVGGLDPATRGSGAVSAVLALWVAHRYADDPAAGLEISAHLLGSDTDTVATMAGALLGAVAGREPPGPILDGDLIAFEARRMHDLSLGERSASFPHPDPLRWEPPTQLVDALGLVDDEPHVAGLGPVRLVDDPIPGLSRNSGLWQWAATEYGQTLLIKRREELRPLPESIRPRLRELGRAINGQSPPPELPALDAQDFKLDDLREASEIEQAPRTPERDAAAWAASSRDPAELGLLLSHWMEQGALPAAVFAAVLSAHLERHVTASA